MPPLDWSISLLVIMFLVALLAGWVDTLAGGGGLLTVPALLLAGLPPVAALATNKAQGFIGPLTATLMLTVKGRLPLRRLLPTVAGAAIGAMLGVLLIQRVDTSWLHWGIPLLLLAVAAYFLINPRLGERGGTARQTEKAYGLTTVPLIAFYDGAIGPGAGSFYAAAGVLLRGQSLLEATIHAKLFNFTSNVAAMALFAAAGQVAWAIGVAMMLGQFCGATLASRTMLHGGERLIRPLVILMCVLMSIAQAYKLLTS
jgi:uncharacterized protein